MALKVDYVHIDSVVKSNHLFKVIIASANIGTPLKDVRCKESYNQVREYLSCSSGNVNDYIASQKDLEEVYEEFVIRKRLLVVTQNSGLTTCFGKLSDPAKKWLYENMDATIDAHLPVQVHDLLKACLEKKGLL
jgi:hypothetical protein